MKLLITLSVLAALCCPALAEDQRFTFMGHAIGDPLSKWSKTLDVDDSTGNCKKPDKNGVKRCRDKSLKKEGFAKKIGDAYVNWLYWIYLDDRLIGFQLSSQLADAETLITMLEGKFGQPQNTSYNELSWDTPHGPLTLSRRDGKADLELFDLKATDIIQDRENKRLQATREAGKKVF